MSGEKKFGISRKAKWAAINQTGPAFEHHPCSTRAFGAMLPDEFSRVSPERRGLDEEDPMRGDAM